MQLLVAPVCISARLDMENEKAHLSYCCSANMSISAHCCEMSALKARVVRLAEWMSDS